MHIFSSKNYIKSEGCILYFTPFFKAVILNPTGVRLSISLVMRVLWLQNAPFFIIFPFLKKTLSNFLHQNNSCHYVNSHRLTYLIEKVFSLYAFRYGFNYFPNKKMKIKIGTVITTEEVLYISEELKML